MKMKRIFLLCSMLMLLGMLLVLPSNRHVGLAEEPDDGEEIETVTFYLPFGPDTVSSGYSGIYASRTGRLYKSAYQSDGLTFSNSYYHGSNDYTTASQRGAIDFVVSQETPIRSVADGTVTKGVLGRSHAACIIKIRHTDGSITGYWHLNQSYVQTGDTVVKGEVIGLSGEQEGDKDGTNCGTAFGAHLHFVRNIGNETTISFADSSLNNHTGRYVRPSKTYFYKADGTIPHDNQYSPSDEFPYGLNPDPDIDPGFPYMIAFVAAGAIDLDNGYYLPNDNVTRAVMAQALVVSLQQERTYDDGVEPFPDVPTNHEDYHFIRRLKELSITGGFSDGTYRPDNEVTRCQMAVMITNARQEAPPPEHTGPPSFPDVPSDHSCLDYIEHIVNLGIAGGYSDGNFHPENSVTRRQIAYMLYKAFPLYFIMNLSSDGSQRTMAAVDTNDHGLPAVEGYHPRFYDVLPDHPFYRYVEAIAKRSITGGCSSIDPTIYCPEDYLTRGQASAFIARSMGREPTYNDGRQTFPDVPSSHAFYDAIEYLAELGGIIGGYSDGNFRPDGDVTKRQLAVMVVNTLKNHLGVTCPTEHTSEFPDAPPSEEAYDWIQCAKDLGITNGDSNGYYNPNDSITRGAAAKFMYIAFIQIIVDIPQEESDSINNNASTAPILPDHNSEIGEHGGYTADMVIPHDDTDWIQVEVEEGETYQFDTYNSNLNLNLEAIPFSSVANIALDKPIPTIRKKRMGTDDRETTITWTSDETGIHYVRLRNLTPFAEEGTSTTISVQKLDKLAEVGDVNCDGSINVVDAMFIMQYGVDMRQSSDACPSTTVDELYEDACDVNGDSTCNVVDAMFIMQCNVDIANDFCPATQ